jgi:hypothetical protein
VWIKTKYDPKRGIIVYTEAGINARLFYSLSLVLILKNNMKTLLLTGVIVVVMGGLALNAKFGQPVEVTNTKLDVATTTVEAVEEEVDMIEAAKAELDRINTELDAEETRLLEAKAAVEAQAAAEVAEIETKLEAIRDTRSGF